MKEEPRIDVIIILIASMTTIFSLIISNILPKLQILILTILTILLAMIYQIGHIYSKEKIKETNEKDFLEIDMAMEELEDENYKLQIKYENLKRKINQHN
jgi:hypothetical protein